MIYLSKYTTEVRYICEQKAGLTESVGFNSVDSVISNSWNKIFTDFPIFDESYRSVLCSKILKHYYTREICAETVGLWQLWLNEKMNLIMPYYNELYKTTVLEFNPLYDVDYETTGTRNDKYDETNENNSNSDFTRTDNLTAKRTDDLSQNRTDNLNQTRTDNLSNSSNSTSYDLYSDTPQGALDGVENETYLTNARKQTENNSGTNTGTQKVDNTGTQTVDNTGTQTMTNTGTQKNEGSESSTGAKNYTNANDYSEHVVGKRGGQSYASMIRELRDNLLNIDAMIIDELEELFFGLW